MSRAKQAAKNRQAVGLTTPSPVMSIDRARDVSGAVVSGWLVTAYLLLIVIGVIVFRTPGATIGGGELSFPRSVFFAVNSATLSGFQQSVALETLLPRGQIMIAILMLGGAWLTTTAASLAVVRIANLPYSILNVATFGLVAIIAVTLFGGVVMSGNGRGFWFGAFQAGSAFTNCGLLLGPGPGRTGSITLFFLLPLAMIGSLGLPVLLELCGWVWRSARESTSTALSHHTRTTLGAWAIVFLIGLAGCIVLAKYTGSDVEKPKAWRAAISDATIANANSRTAGLPIDAVHSYPRTLPWLLIVLMAIGGASASFAGGLKVTTLWSIFHGTWRSLRRLPTDRTFGIALVWLGTYAALLFSCFLCLLHASPELTADRALFTIVSAASNVGLSHDPIALGRANYIVLCAAMLLGRLLPIILLWCMAMITTRDEDVAVG